MDATTRSLEQLAKSYGQQLKDIQPLYDQHLKEPDANPTTAFKRTKQEMVETFGHPEETVPPIEKPKEAEAKPAQLDADDYLKRASTGNWLTASMVNEGDRMTLLEGIREDAVTFERPYIIAPVRLGDDEYDLRLGVRNVKRLRDVFGPDVSKWVGRQIEVAVVQTYKLRGAEQRGLILRGVKETS